MLVKELKETVNKYNSEDKTKIITELYKRIPKRVKEDYDIDEYLRNINRDKEVKKEEKNRTIDEVENEVGYFLKCVSMDLYASPNRIISKKERSSWRFKVKRYYKELNTFKPDTPKGERATNLLGSLFYFLSYGTHYLKFSNWNTFGAIGIPQADYYETLCKRIISNGLVKENIKKCIHLLNNEYDPTSYYEDMYIVFRNLLTTVDSKYTAIEVLKEEIDNRKEKIKELKKNRKETYYEDEKNEYFIKCILDIYLDLREIEKGIKYFKKNYVEIEEVTEYILLNRLELYQLHDEWIKEYETNLDKIEYRDSLKEKYKEIKGKQE